MNKCSYCRNTGHNKRTCNERKRGLFKLFGFGYYWDSNSYHIKRNWEILLNILSINKRRLEMILS
jgi:hypothetical protein